VPVDGSADSLLGVGMASNLARSAGAAIGLLRVVVPLPLWIFDPTLGLNTGPLIDPRWDEDRRENAEHYVRQLAQRLVDSGLEAGADAVLGEPAASIAEYADQEGMDLIVMSTHTRGGPARALLGSVADAVVRNAHQPVLLVNRASAVGSTNANAPS
jgi:nucleotide-binding universal stress UspA family protein